MGIFEKLKALKENGITLYLDNLSSDDLRKMYIDEEKTDYAIAQLFEVKESKITYKRRKNGISIRNSILDEFLLGKSDHAIEMNSEVKNKIFNIENISMISKATHFAFRNGPIEDMHASPNSQLSEVDMKILNKFMVNRLAYVFKLMLEERWIEFDFLVRNTDLMYGSGWDNAEPDDGRTRKVIELILKKDKRK
jgi:DNA-dependent RNA polymerase auxiliary subunit epsilon